MAKVGAKFVASLDQIWGQILDHFWSKFAGTGANFCAILGPIFGAQNWDPLLRFNSKSRFGVQNLPPDLVQIWRKFGAKLGPKFGPEI